MSRKYNITTRMLKAYENYVQQFTKRSAAQLAKGYQIEAPEILPFEQFKSNREYLSRIGVAPGNITRTIVSNQLYEYSQVQAEEMYNALQELGIIDESDMTIYGTKVTLEALKSKGGLGGEALSLINDRLKEVGYNGYERAAWITNQIYQDSE